MSLAHCGTVPHPSFFLYSNTNHLVQLEDTTIKTERGCSMQRTEGQLRITDQIYFITWGEWVELTDKMSEVRQTRWVRWDRQDEWGETDKTMAEEFQNEIKAPVLKIFWILKSLLTSAINLGDNGRFF